MNKLRRRNDIVEYINEKGFVSFSELKDRFPDNSEMTLRTDLKELDAQGRINRVRGGARAAVEIARADDSYFLRDTRDREHRLQIARKAAEYLKKELAKKPLVTVYLDCGVGITDIARLFPDEWCTVVTNSISVAYALAEKKKPSVMMLGGMLNRYNCCCDSTTSANEITHMNFDIMFLSTAAFDIEAGFSCGKEVIDGPRWSVIKKASKVIVPLTSSKIGQVYPITHANLSDVEIIISDDDMPADIKRYITENGVEVL